VNVEEPGLFNRLVADFLSTVQGGRPLGNLEA
jgi:hypothetical protein